MDEPTIQPNEWEIEFDTKFSGFYDRNESYGQKDIKDFIHDQLQRVRLEAYEQGVKDGEKYESTSNQINNSKLH